MYAVIVTWMVADYRFEESRCCATYQCAYSSVRRTPPSNRSPGARSLKSVSYLVIEEGNNRPFFKFKKRSQSRPSGDFDNSDKTDGTFTAEPEVHAGTSQEEVAVGIIDLTPSFDYETVPQLSPHAFLKANIKNTSQYAFLPGPCNIFLNNNFVAKSELDSVSPGEEFHCSLGVDPAIKITYKPIKKFVEKGGIITKTTTTTYQQDIEVKNNHLELIKITVKDNIPRSSTDKIKVNLIEPALSKNSEKKEKNMTIKMNKQNNIEWHLELASSESKEVNIKYSVDVPTGEETNSQVVFSALKQSHV